MNWHKKVSGVDLQHKLADGAISNVDPTIKFEDAETCGTIEAEIGAGAYVRAGACDNNCADACVGTYCACADCADYRPPSGAESPGGSTGHLSSTMRGTSCPKCFATSSGS